MPSIKELMKKGEALFATQERQNNENLWSELSEFFLNNQYIGSAGIGVSSRPVTPEATNPGAKRTRRLFDSTALQAVQDLASSFQGTLTNPATTWSRLRYQREDLNNDEEAVMWLEAVNRIMHNKFNESNFNTEIAKTYQSLVSLANSVLFLEDDGKGGFRFTAMHITRVAWTENKDGLVDTLYHKFSMTAKQIIEKWGENVDENILKAAENAPTKEFEILHCVYPRAPKDIKLNEAGLAPAKYRPVASVYIDLTHQKTFEEGGYYEMPIFVARWSLMPGEMYGRGPGHLALPDVRTLNRLKMRGLEAIDLQVRPPILANQRDVFGQLDMRPGNISIVKNVDGVREFVSQARNDILQFSIEELRDSIRSIFFLDKLLLPPRTETGEMTAFEVAQRVEQMQRVLGPVLSRLNNEVLNPLVVRAFKMMLRSGVLPPIPDILVETGLDIEIVFVNQLARSQQIEDVNTIQQWAQLLGQLAQMDPSIIDNIDMDGIAKHTAKVLGVPEAAVQNDDEMAAIRQQRAQQQQQAQALDTAVAAADVASKVGKTE